MPIRITGMNSGLDTESIITELVKAKSAKKDELVKAQTKLQWKQDAWKELNSKVYSFYSKTLSNMRLTSDYYKKTTKVSNSTAATVITGANAVNGVQTLKIDKLAKTGYLTGGELQKDGKKASYGTGTKLSELGITESSTVRLTTNGKTTNIDINGDMTINDVVTKLKNAGVNASFDTKNQRFFVSAKEEGAAADFTLSSKDAKGLDALNKLGLATNNEYANLCKAELVDGKYVAKDEAELQSVIDAEVSSRVAQYTANVKSYKATDEKIKEINDKYSSLDTVDNLKNAIEKEKEAGASDERIKELESQLAAREELDKLTQQQNDLKEAIKTANPAVNWDVDSPNFAVGNFATKADSTTEFEATDALKTAVRDEVLAEATFAADVLNGTAKAADGSIIKVSSGAYRTEGQDAEIYLNGALFKSNTNTFEINGLTITANAETADEFTLTTTDDTDGIYDMVKNFIKEYNELIIEMDKLYNADAAKGYEPLTDEEKEAMSEKEIEKWEEKIKDSILRKDSTLNSVSSAMKSIMMQGVKMSDGRTMSLSDFGINTLGYFNAAENERGAYHIDGNPDDDDTKDKADKLKTAIANNAEQTVEFFVELTRGLYEKLGSMMKKTQYSSSFTLYDDLAMKDDYKDYTDKITKQEQKITDFEDRYYRKFSAMETALAKLTAKESALSGLFGM